MVSTSANEDSEDVWCIDPRGLLTLSVSKETYERLGLIGKKLPFRNCSERHGVFLLSLVQLCGWGGGEDNKKYIFVLTKETAM